MPGKRAGVGVMVLGPEEDCVLLGFHIKTQQWRMPGGWNEDNETMRETALRESLEETGLDLKYKFLTGNCWGETKDCLWIGYFVKYPETPQIINPEPETFKEWKWFPLSRIPQPLFDPTEEILNEYCNNVGEDWNYE